MVNTLEIQLFSFPSGAAKATGATIIIDVFRAFTTATYAFASGASEIIMVGELDEALALKTSGRVDFSIGEREGLMPPGFDFGNSPTAMRDADFSGQRLALTTSNGTKAMLAATAAARRFTGALVNLTATVNAAGVRAEALSIVAAGRKGTIKADEDELCAGLMRNHALGLEMDHPAVRAHLQAHFLNEAFLASRAKFGPSSDWELACDVDRFDFAIEVRQEGGLLVARADCAHF